jgi:hypothetical protein
VSSLRGTALRFAKLRCRADSTRPTESVRDLAELAHLPAAERAAWTQFWIDVAAVLKRTPTKE